MPSTRLPHSHTRLLGGLLHCPLRDGHQTFFKEGPCLLDRTLLRPETNEVLSRPFPCSFWVKLFANQEVQADVEEAAAVEHHRVVLGILVQIGQELMRHLGPVAKRLDVMCDMVAIVESNLVVKMVE